MDIDSNRVIDFEKQLVNNRVREKAKSCLLFVIQPGFKMKKKEKIKKKRCKMIMPSCFNFTLLTSRCLDYRCVLFKNFIQNCF